MAEIPARIQPSRRRPPTQAVNFTIDVVTLVVMLAVAATGLVLRYVLPPGSRGGRGLQLWGLTRHEWGDVHFWLVVALGGLIVVHVTLHWTWVCAVMGRWCRVGQSSAARRFVYGVAFLAGIAALLGAIVWLASVNTIGPARGL